MPSSDVPRTSDLARTLLAGLKDGAIERGLAVDLLKQINRRQDIAIIGIGVQHAGGDDYDSLWNTWVSGDSYIKRCTPDRLADVACLCPPIGRGDPRVASKGGYLPDISGFDHDVFGYTRDDAATIFPQARIAISTAFRALEDAGLAGEALDDNATGVFVGYNYSKDQLKSYVNLVHEHTLGSDPFNQQVGSWSSGMATRVAMAFDLRGPAYLVDSSCPSSMLSVINACQALRTGQCSTALAGGLYVDMTPSGIYNRLGFSMAESDDVVTKLLDRENRGSFSGEYCGFLVLKLLDKAIADGDLIHAVIRGSALNNNGSETGYWNSSPKSIARAFGDLVENSGVQVDDIGLFVGEGYANTMEEGLEVAGAAAGFRRFTKRNQFCAMTAMSPVLGYINSGVGISNLVAAVLALKHGQIPALVHFDAPTDSVDLVDSPFYVPTSTRQWETPSGRPAVAVAYAYGFGGTNAMMAIEQAPASTATPADTGEERETLYVVSGQSEQSFRAQLAADLAYLEAGDDTTFRAICYSACARRRHHGRIRLAVTARSRSELVEALRQVQASGEPGERAMIARFDKPVSAKRRRSIDGRTPTDCAAGFVRGETQALGSLFEPAERVFVRLPAYPLDPVRCWVEPIAVSRIGRLARLIKKPSGFAERIEK